MDRCLGRSSLRMSSGGMGMSLRGHLVQVDLGLFVLLRPAMQLAMDHIMGVIDDLEGLQLELDLLVVGIFLVLGLELLVLGREGLRALLADLEDAFDNVLEGAFI